MSNHNNTQLSDAQDNALESQDFFDLMQSYRHTSAIDQHKVCERFKAVKAFIRANVTPSPSQKVEEVAAGEQRLSVTPEVAAKLIHLRDTLAKMESSELLNEAWHTLYSIADPEIESFVPWSELEKLAASAVLKRETPRYEK